jgi:hypothetical protein
MRMRSDLPTLNWWLMKVWSEHIKSNLLEAFSRCAAQQSHWRQPLDETRPSKRYSFSSILTYSLHQGNGLNGVDCAYENNLSIISVSKRPA